MKCAASATAAARAPHPSHTRRASTRAHTRCAVPTNAAAAARASAVTFAAPSAGPPLNLRPTLRRAHAHRGGGGTTPCAASPSGAAPTDASSEAAPAMGSLIPETLREMETDEAGPLCKQNPADPQRVKPPGVVASLRPSKSEAQAGAIAPSLARHKLY
jgi:hypothetical protein